jgi:cytochrome c-type biogenesis protein CcmH/NrfG
MSHNSTLEAFLDGRLTPPELAAFKAHLTTCATCEAKVAHWQTVTHGLRALSAPEPERPTLSVQHLLARARVQQPKVSAPGWWVVPGMAVAGLTVALVFWAPWASPRVAQSDTPVVPPKVEPAPTNTTAMNLEAPLAEDLPVHVGADFIRLGAGGRAQVLLSSAGAVRINMREGRVAIQAAPRVASSPLIVAAGGVEVHVVGTVFSVSLRLEKDVRVSVSEGRVRVLSGGREVMVEAGRQVDVARSGLQAPVDLLAEERALLDATVVAQDQVTAPPSAPDAGPRPFVAPSSPAGPKPPPKRSAAAPLSPAYDLLEDQIAAGQAAVARETLEPHLQRVPSDTRGWELLAEAHRKLGAWQKAVDAYAAVRRTGPPSSANLARFKAAVVLQERLHDEPSAATLLREYLAQPASLVALAPEALLRLAVCERAMGHQAISQGLLRELVRRHPGTAPAEEAGHLLAEPGVKPGRPPP